MKALFFVLLLLLTSCNTGAILTTIVDPCLLNNGSKNIVLINRTVAVECNDGVIYGFSFTSFKIPEGADKNINKQPLNINIQTE